MSDQPRIALAPGFRPGTSRPADVVADAITAGGGQLVDPAGGPDALVWLDAGDVDGLRRALDMAPGARWVQLPFAGIEPMVGAGVLTPDRTWTCAKGTYGLPCAEHALMLALAGLRSLPRRIRATSWGAQASTTLVGAEVTVVGGGGIARELLRLLEPFATTTTVVRRTPDPVPGAARVRPVTELHDALSGALVVVLALALTPATRGIIGAPELAAMRSDAWLVNVARGGHVDTEALVAALDAGRIGGAALDVTDPEPLPEGHPLWGRDDCIITPHTANPFSEALPLLAERVRRNVAAFAAGDPLEGLVDIAAGY